MQFGQPYNFNKTSITKETSTGADYFREPRLLEIYDKTKYYLQRYSKLDKRENYLNEQQEDFKNMINSVEKYEGYYIGRYETGDDITHNYYHNNKGGFINPKIVRYNENINYVTWYDSYKDLQRLSGKTDKYVETGMIFDTMWDYTLKWLNETDTRSYEDIATDSGTWGNYDNNSFKYKKSANGTEYTKDVYSSGRIITGGITEILYNGEINNNSPTSSNNIFDIAGNVFEWTSSRYGANGRKQRGSYYYGNSSLNPARNASSSDPNSNSGYYGVRAQLYIL